MIADKYAPLLNGNERMTQVRSVDVPKEVIAITMTNMSVNIWFKDNSRLRFTADDLHSDLKVDIHHDR